jgi:hypothetical protein
MPPLRPPLRPPRRLARRAYGAEEILVGHETTESETGESYVAISKANEGEGKSLFTLRL